MGMCRYQFNYQTFELSGNFRELYAAALLELAKKVHCLSIFMLIMRPHVYRDYLNKHLGPEGRIFRVCLPEINSRSRAQEACSLHAEVLAGAFQGCKREESEIPQMELYMSRNVL